MTTTILRLDAYQLLIALCSVEECQDCAGGIDVIWTADFGWRIQPRHSQPCPTQATRKREPW